MWKRRVGTLTAHYYPSQPRGLTLLRALCGAVNAVGRLTNATAHTAQCRECGEIYRARYIDQAA